MRRREFIALLGSATAWPFTARAQQPDRMRRIGILMNPADDASGRVRAAAFGGGLQELGWTEGRNIRVDYRLAGSDLERSLALAKELIDLQPDVIVAGGTLPLRSLSQQTRSLPIVFANVSDPVGDGFVASLAHPGGNITGFSQYEYTIGGKWLELLKQIMPAISRVAVTMNAANPASRQYLRAIESAAVSAGVQVTPLVVYAADELERGIGEFARGTNGGLIVLPGAGNVVGREQIVRLANHHRLPAIYSTHDDATNGGLMSYGLDNVDPWHRAAAYVDRILKGEKPGDLPVQQPTKYQLVINLKTAKAFGLTVPLTLLGRADEMIE